MTRTGPTQPIPQRFVLRPRLSVSALGVASACALAGAVLLVVSSAYGWPLVGSVLAAVLLLLGLMLAVVAAFAYRKVRQTLILDEMAITVQTGRTQRRLLWSDVVDVTLNGTRLVLRTKSEGGAVTEVIQPAGSSATTFMALAEAIRERLDADRGYVDRA